MVHNAIAMIEATQNFCVKHQTNPDDCRRLHTPSAMLAAGLLGASAGAAIKGDRGAAVGLVTGLLFGALYPEIAQPSRLRPLAQQMHAFQGGF